ncbi:MAG: DUF6519 domain-containing protein, partial [Thermoproteota archaeon]|nr:DUF6519 domain-containing protein [Thermoproteota archaeon]
MKGDFTRSTFRKENHYHKVNMQQGRVQIDADWNEQNDIQLHYEKSFLRDLVGKNGTLAENNGFEILPNLEVPWNDIADQGKNNDFKKFLRENFSLLWIKEDSEFIGNNANSYQVIEDNTNNGVNHNLTITRDSVAGTASLVADGNHIYDFYYSSDKDALYTFGFRVGKSQITGKEKSAAGNYYVDGILCENEYTVDASMQPDLQIYNVKFFIFRWGFAPSSSRALAYLLQELLPSFGHELPSSLIGELKVTRNPANENEIIVSSGSGSTKMTLDKTNRKAILEYGS